jgi:solute carrier family 13 (sodium-dependent dicarboxylate transporter), member 2/3/5
MKTMQEAFASIEAYSPAEEQFNRRRRSVGLVLAPLLFGAVLLWPMPALSPEAHRLAAILALVVTLWVSEALPMAAVAMLGPLLAVLLGVTTARAAFASFGDPIVFLFIGSFMLAQAMFVHGVDRRLAYSALSWEAVGRSGGRILLVYGAVATVLSMWVSNTATTAMMFPIGMAIVAHMAKAGRRGQGDIRRFAMGMMLVTAFGASVGGMATPVGTPPNLIGIGLIDRIQGVHIGFFRWMAIGLPLMVVLFAFLSALFYLTCARGVTAGEGSATLVRDELKKLGRVSAGERNVLLAFGTTVLLWLMPGLLALAGLGDTPFAVRFTQAVPESVAALTGAMLLFVLPVSWRSRRFTLSWEQAVRIDWGIVLLYGGGLALGELAFSTGLASAGGTVLTGYLPSQSTFALVVAFTGLAILLSEITSNTAAANMIVPVAIAVAKSAGVDPLLPAVGATLGASMGFMMPISTAPNAIVYSSGFVPITKMMKFGAVLDLAAFVAIVTLVMTVGEWVF